MLNECVMKHFRATIPTWLNTSPGSQIDASLPGGEVNETHAAVLKPGYVATPQGTTMLRSDTHFLPFSWPRIGTIIYICYRGRPDAP